MRAWRSSLSAWLAFGCAAVLTGVRADPVRSLTLPERSPQALSGTQFAGKVWNLSLAERDEQIRREVLSGNIPNFLRQFCPVNVTNVSGARTNTATIFVAADYLAIGSDADFLRIPMRPETAQEIAEAVGCVLPTPRMVDAIWTAAAKKLAPSPISPSAAMTTVAVFSNHNFVVQEQCKGTAPGMLVAGHKKDVVVCSRLKDSPGKVAIYGWHRDNGEPIQPLYLGHSAGWVDYSQCVRLVHRVAIVNGRSMLVDDLLKSPSLAPLLSDEGPIGQARYPIRR